MELLEREPFLEALRDYATDADSGNGRLVVITGEAGIGKTSLVDAFRDARPDIDWHWSACDGGFTPRPLGPLHEIATRAGGQGNPQGRPIGIAEQALGLGEQRLTPFSRRLVEPCGLGGLPDSFQTSLKHGRPRSEPAHAKTGDQVMHLNAASAAAPATDRARYEFIEAFDARSKAN